MNLIKVTDFEDRTRQFKVELFTVLFPQAECYFEEVNRDMQIR